MLRYIDYPNNVLCYTFTDFRGPRDSGNNIVPPSPSSKGKGDSPLQNPDDPISDESGVGHEEEEAELLLELLSNIRTPKVSITYLNWSIFIIISQTNDL
jgi:hypothetical protein